MGKCSACNMMNARLREDDLDVFTFGCQAHLLNLAANDLQEKHKAVVAKIVDVLKAFRNVHELSAALVERDVGKPPLPGETRWCSARDAFKYYDENWTTLADIASQKLRLGDPHRMVLESIQIRRSASELFTMFDVLAKGLNRMQRRETTIGKAVDIWLDVLQEFPKGANKTFVEERSKNALKTPFFLLANILDHRYQGKRLSKEQMALAHEYVHNVGPEQSDAFAQYLAKDPPFKPYMFDQKVLPTSWWKTGLVLGFPDCLASLSIALVFFFFKAFPPPPPSSSHPPSPPPPSPPHPPSPPPPSSPPHSPPPSSHPHPTPIPHLPLTHPACSTFSTHCNVIGLGPRCL